jgi:hypothetical protein
LDKILTCDALLDSVDLRCKCNVIEILLRVVRKCSTPLLTDTEIDDVLKKREKQIAESRLFEQYPLAIHAPTFCCRTYVVFVELQ